MKENWFIIHQGKRYARVSSVISPHVDFSHIPPEVLKRKADIGTMVHQAAHDDIMGELPDLPPECLGYFASYRRWKDRLKPEFLQSEQRYFNDDLKITGCIDGLIRLQYEDTPILIDWKTSVSESPTWKLQAHLYSHLIREAGMAISKRSLFIRLDKFGAYPTIFEYVYNSDIHEFTIKCVKQFWDKVEKDYPFILPSDIVNS